MRFWMNQGTTMRFHDIEKDIEYCNKYEFEAIELKYSLIRNYNLIWIKELLCENKIHVGSIGSLWLPILQKREVIIQEEMKLRNLCQCARILDAEFIIIIPPRGLVDVERGRILEDAVEILRKYSDIAKEYNIKLALEIMGFSNSCIRTIKDGLVVINMTEKKNIGIVYDFYHVLGMEKTEQAILEMRPENLYIVHVNDGINCNVGNYNDDNRLWPFDGDIDIEGQLRMLKEIHYFGPFSVEVYQPHMWTIDMEECYEIAQDRLRKMEQFMLV